MNVDVEATASSSRVAPAAGDALAAFYTSIGMPSRLGDLHIPREDLPMLAREATKNFNANPGERGSEQEQVLLQLLQAAW